MAKLLCFIILAFFGSLWLGMDSVKPTVSHLRSTPAPTPDSSPEPSPSPTPRGRRNLPPVNTPPNVDDINLDKTTLFLGCPPGHLQRGGNCPEGQIVDVLTKASDKDNDTIVYDYSVTGGRIIGHGANVKWDLSGVRPGIYKITASADDGCGPDCGKTISRSVTVEECTYCGGNCECTRVEVSRGVEKVKQGQTATFTAKVSGGSVHIDKYIWTVSYGKIIDGQGTTTIKVDTKGLGGKTIIATLRIGGSGPNTSCLEICPTTTVSAPVSVVSK